MVKRATGITKGKQPPSDEQKAKNNERMRQSRERNKRNEQLVRAMGLADDDGKLTKAGDKIKSKTQRANEARLELQTRVLDLYASGQSVDDVAIALNLNIDQTKKFVEDGINQLVQHHARASPADNFGRYAHFHMRTIQRLDKLIEQFIADKDSKQYNAVVQALRAQSDVLDKVYAKGKALGVMKLDKAAPERGMSGQDLVEALVRERQQLDAVIAELSVTITSKTVTAKVKRAPKGQSAVVDVTALQADENHSHVEDDEGQGTDLMSGTVGDALAAEIVRERARDREE